MKIKAIYKKRENDNYDFVAAFAGIGRHMDANQFAFGLMKEGEELIRTPTGARKLEDLLEEVDTTYFSKRQMFVESIEKQIGKGTISVSE